MVGSSKPNKQGEKEKSQPGCGSGDTLGRWRVARSQNKKTYKPSGHLSSLGTKMFQSQNISLVEFQGLRGKKKKLKRGSQTYIYIKLLYIYIEYIEYTQQKKKEDNDFRFL